MPIARSRGRRRPLTVALAGLLTAAGLLATGPLGPAGAQETTTTGVETTTTTGAQATTTTRAPAPKPHWGLYRWDGGQEKADIRAFWLFDRTGNPQLHNIIRTVTDAWNAARDDNENAPFIAVYQDDANAGRCFVNQAPGYSVASACTMPNNIEGVKGIAARNPDDKGHLIGAAFAISEGLRFEEAFTLVCHMFGHVMGLDNSEDDESCMSHTFEPNRLKWYTQAEADAVTALYAHSETVTATTTTSSPSTTTTVPGATTTTAGGGGATTTTTAGGGGATTTTTAGGGGTTSSTSGLPITVTTQPPPTLLPTTTAG